MYYSRGKRENGKHKFIFKGKLLLAQQIKLVFSVYAFMVLGMFLLPWDFACFCIYKINSCIKWSCQTLFEMEDIAVSVCKYHVASYVPDFQTKPADFQPTQRKSSET